MGPSISFLSAALQTLAAGLAFRLARSTRFRWGWLLIASAMSLQAVRRISAGLELKRSGAPLPDSEWIAFGASLLVLLGMAALQGFSLERQRAGDSPKAPERAEHEQDRLRDRQQQDTTEPQASLRQIALSAQFLETVVDTADAWISALDTEARVVLWNQAAERLSGYRREELLGRSGFWELLYPDEAYRAEIMQEVSDLLPRNEPILNRETGIRIKSGETRFISWSIRRLRNAPGEISGTLAVGQDVTDFRQTAEQLQRVHAVQTLLLEHNVLGIAYVQDRRLIWGNPRAAEMFGVPLDEFIGAPARSIYPNDTTYEEIGRKSYPLMGQGGVSDTRVQMRRASGQYFWCRLVGMAVDPSKPHAGSVWLAEDISKQVTAEAALLDSEARFRGAFEGTQDALLLLTLDGIFDCNQRALDLFGFTYKAEMLRLQPADLSPARQPGGEDSRREATKYLRRAFQEGSVQFKWEHRRRNVGTFPAEVLLSSFRMGRRTVVQACVRDIQERIKAETSLRDSEARFRLLFERYADPLLLLDSETSAFVDYNQAALDMLRCTRDELNRLRPVDLSPEFQPDGSPSREAGLEMIRIALRRGSHRFLWVHRSCHRDDFKVDVLLTLIQPGTSPLVFASWRELPPE